MSEITSPPSNIPQFSVSDISGAIKRLLEGNFSRVRVRGEVTEVKYYSSGHVYFSLKDEGAKISAVIWRSALPRLTVKPENGMEVIATGRISSYGERSNYQLMVDRMEFAGEGALLARIEQLKQKFISEGLFETVRKKPIPFLPQRIGVITSPSGAVLHDICTTVERRFPREILLYPVKVQGDGASHSIVKALEEIVMLNNPPDVIIVARGGGSLEDLMAFNEENVIRAVAACPIPVISAVGHETDTTLIDFVSDKRAPTPTAAAEMAVPLRSLMLEDLEHRGARLVSGLASYLQNRRMSLERIVTHLPDLPSLLDHVRMQLDDKGERLEHALPRFMQSMRACFASYSYALPSLETILLQRTHSLERCVALWENGWKNFYQQQRFTLTKILVREDTIRDKIRIERAIIDGVGKNLEAVSPHAVLKRGYVFVQDDETGKPITNTHLLPYDKNIRLNFADGMRRARLLHEEGK